MVDVDVVVVAVAVVVVVVISSSDNNIHLNYTTATIQLKTHDYWRTKTREVESLARLLTYSSLFPSLPVSKPPTGTGACC